MVDICKLLSVKRGIDAVDAEGSILVEKCKEYDAALAGYSIVCDREDLPGIIAWVSENMKDISDYIKGTFEGENPTFGFTLIRSTLNLGSFTQEFVEGCGSVQAFLDKYGVSPSLEFSEEQEPEPRVEAPPLAQDMQGTDELFHTESMSIPQSLAPAYDGEEPQDNFSDVQDDFNDEQDDFGTSSESVNPNSIFATDFEEKEEASAETEPVVKLAKEPEPVIAEKAEADIEEKSVLEESKLSEESPVLEEPMPEETYLKETVPEEEPAVSVCLDKNGDTIILDPEETYDVECSGIDISSLKFRNGKVIVPFCHLSELVGQVLLASSVIEQNDSNGFEILTNDSKFAAAQLVERYAPTVVKEFVLNYVRGATSDADLVRITKMLNEFCSFVADKKILSFNKEAL